MTGHALAPSRGPRPKTNVERQFCDLGDDAQAFLVGAAAIGNTRLGSELEILLALGAATAPTPWSPHCTGPSRSDDSAPLTCARSWPPVSVHHNPARPGTR